MYHQKEYHNLFHKTNSFIESRQDTALRWMSLNIAFLYYFDVYVVQMYK